MSAQPKQRIAWGSAALMVVVFVLSGTLGGTAYFHFGDPQNTCASCHEMGGVHVAWTGSSHRTLHCRNCHGGSLTLDVHALGAHLNRVVQHFTGDPGKPIRLSERDILHAAESCRTCHSQSYAEWQSSRHATTYARIFLDPAYTSVPPAPDCLRCHGMFFDGQTADLLSVKTPGKPLALQDPARAALPAIPCLACHQIHVSSDAPQPHFFDRREWDHFPSETLPIARVWRDSHLVRVSSDPRQRICVQCHAPGAEHQHGTSDDRTPAGVHEGLSCLDCHRTHNQSVQNSCAACHPANSHCGLAVERMDTTFLSPDSGHNVHFVRCEDCHPQGRPDPLRTRNPISN